MWQHLWVTSTSLTKSAMPWWMSEMEPWVGIIVISETQTRKEKTNRAHLIAQETVKEQSSAMRNSGPLEQGIFRESREQKYHFTEHMAHQRVRQEDSHKFKASLVYILRLSPPPKKSKNNTFYSNHDHLLYIQPQFIDMCLSCFLLLW